MISSRLLLALAVAGVLLTSCATTSRIPPELQYSAPAPGSSTATIRGSERPSVILDSFTAYVHAVDGKRVMAGEKGWRTPLVITAGQHTLAVEFERGSYHAQAELSLNAAPGAEYEVRFDTDVQTYGRNSYVDFWIVNARTGKAVTGIKRAAVNLAGGSGTYIPIPIVVPAG